MELRAWTLVQGLDWADTPLGRIDGWPPALRGALSLILATDTPMLLLAGQRLVTLGNDAWRHLAGAEDVAQPGQATLADVPEARALGPLVEAALSGRCAVSARDLPLFSGSLRDVALWPVLDDAGQAHGVVVLAIPAAAAPAQAQPPLPDHFAAIVASAEDAILSVDRHLRITSWNGGARRLFGYRADEVLGQPVALLSPQPEEDWANLDRLLRGQRIPPYQTVRLHKDGKRLHVSLAIAPLLDPLGEVVGAAFVARDGTDSHAVEHLHRLLIGEMKHRVKNILSTVQAIARQTLGSERTPAYVTFEKRILALGRAQDLITRDADEGVELQALVAAVLAPFSQVQVQIDGPPMRFSSRAAVALTLGLHELATNAAKYGALSVPSGRVRVWWNSLGDPHPAEFTLHWREEGGPPVTGPAKRGFGSALIQDVLAAELQGRVDLRLAAQGVECDIIAPMASVREQAL